MAAASSALPSEWVQSFALHQLLYIPTGNTTGAHAEHGDACPMGTMKKTHVGQTKLTGASQLLLWCLSLTTGLRRQTGSGAKLDHLMSWHTANHHLKKAVPYLLHQLSSHHINSPSHAGRSRNISPADLLCKGSVAELRHPSSAATQFCVTKRQCFHEVPNSCFSIANCLLTGKDLLLKERAAKSPLWAPFTVPFPRSPLQDNEVGDCSPKHILLLWNKSIALFFLTSECCWDITLFSSESTKNHYTTVSILGRNSIEE